MNGVRVRAVQLGPMAGLLACVMLLGGLSATVGISPVGWVAGLVCAAGTNLALALDLTRHRARGLGPADRVTLTRATLVSAVVALTADSFVAPARVPALVGVTVVALALDWVDGQVARRTRTASAFGARFDMEVDALLILVLSVYVARTAGAWVLLIGAARYALLFVGLLKPWLHRPTPPRYWGKVVAATQGVVLVTAAAAVLPPAVTNAALVVASALLAESFGHQVRWLSRHREDVPQRGGTGAVARAMPGPGAHQAAA